MNKKIFIYVFIAFILGTCAGNYAMSDTTKNYKIAVVDIQQVVLSSNQVQALKKQHEEKTNELKTMLTKAQKEISEKKDEKERKDLISKYDNQIKAFKDKNDKTYETKLLEIDKSINNTIQTEAKKRGYDIVLAKGLVLYGGEDITNHIKKIVK